MTVQEKFDILYNEIRLKLQKEIDEARKGVSKKSIQQLSTIMGDIQQMSEVRNDKTFLPSYPRFIIDSWDFTDPLGMELINLLEIYKKLS
jgi:hypothetical protein